MSDLEILTALNRDYIASVQASDTKRFGEILSEISSTPIPTARWSTRRAS